MARNGCDCRHGKGKERRYNRFERFNHVVQAVSGPGDGSGSLSPCEVEAIGEEFTLGCGDKNGATGGLGLGSVES